MVHSGFRESPQPIRTPKGIHSGLLSNAKALRPQRGRGRKARLRTSSSSLGSGTTEYLRQVAATWRMNTKTRGLPQPQICLRQDLSMQQGKGQGLRVAPMEGRGGAGGATPRLTFPPLPYSPVILSAKALRYPLSQTHELGPSQSSSPTSICFLPPSPPLLIFPFVSETM